MYPVYLDCCNREPLPCPHYEWDPAYNQGLHFTFLGAMPGFCRAHLGRSGDQPQHQRQMGPQERQGLHSTNPGAMPGSHHCQPACPGEKPGSASKTWLPAIPSCWQCDWSLRDPGDLKVREPRLINPWRGECMVSWRTAVHVCMEAQKTRSVMHLGRSSGEFQVTEPSW